MSGFHEGSRFHRLLVKLRWFTLRIMKITCPSIVLVSSLVSSLFSSFALGAPSLHPIELTASPLVMRLDKDEFRIAFGVNGERFSATGCTGSIRYRVDWRTSTGEVGSEIKQVRYSVSPGSTRTIAVDRQFFDTAEGAHTTDVVNVNVRSITCRPSSSLKR